MNKVKPNRERLLFVLHCYHNRAGTEAHTKLLARALAAECNVAVVYPERGSIWLREISPEGEAMDTVTEYSSATVPFPIAPYSHPPSEHALSAALASFQPTIIHLQHFIYWPLSLIDQLNKTGVPVVVSFHDYFALTPYFTMQGALSASAAFAPEYVTRIFGADVTKYLLDRLAILSRSLQDCAACITPSRYLARILGEAYQLSYQVIEHGIAPYTNPISRYAGEPFRFGFVGSLLPQKGWRELYEAFPELRKSFPGVELHLFGGGEAPPSNPYKGAFFHGVYEQQDLPDILSQFNVGVIPSLFAETHCLVLSELWQGRIPVVASAIGALAERIIPNVNGALFDPGDQRSLVEVLSSILSTDSWRSWSLPSPRSDLEMVADYRALYRELGSHG